MDSNGGFILGMSHPADTDSLSRDELKTLVEELLGRVSALSQTVVEQREEIARLKGLKGRPDIKPPSQPSGMEKANRPHSPAGQPRRGGGPKTSNRAIDEDRILAIPGLPPGSIFKGYQDYVVQDLVFRKHVVRYRRERWLTPDGRELVAETPAGVKGHFGAELRRFVLGQYHQGQVTTPRLLAQLLAIGIEISKRQLMRLLIAGHEPFLEEARDVLRAGLSHASWVGVDDTGARHKGRNAVCTQIGNDSFAWFGTTYSKSRVNFLECLRAGFTDYVVNDEALAYMRAQRMPAFLVARLAADAERSFADAEAWSAHLHRLGVSELKTNPDPTQVATEGALLGAVLAHGFLAMAVILSDDAGQFNILYHALCWVHAERLVHKLDAFNEANRAAQQAVRGQIWDLYRDLIAYKSAPSSGVKAELDARFDAIFQQRTGFVTLDKLLKRLHANKDELLVVLDRPEIPLHTNATENTIRDYVTKRKVSGGTRSDRGRDCRDAFLGLLKTCKKQGIKFWDYLGSRLKVPDAIEVPGLPALVKARCAAG
jgi:hypothetical protein